MNDLSETRVLSAEDEEAEKERERIEIARKVNFYAQALLLALATRRFASPKPKKNIKQGSTLPTATLVLYNLRALQKARCLDALNTLGLTSLTPGEKRETDQIINVCVGNINIFTQRLLKGDEKWDLSFAKSRLVTTCGHIVAALNAGSLLELKTEEKTFFPLWSTLTKGTNIFPLLSVALKDQSILMPQDIGFPETMTAVESMKAFTEKCDRASSGFARKTVRGWVYPKVACTNE